MRNIVKQSLRRILPLASMIAIAIPLYAAITGSISGTVSDPRGAVMPGVTVMALNEATGVIQTVTSDSKGFYSFPALDVGTYTIKTSVNGFESYEEKGIGVDANSAVRADIALKVGRVTQVEVITSNALQIETQSSQVGEVLDSKQMLAVPLNGRSFTDLLSLQPGVAPGTNIEASDTPTPSGQLNTGSVSVNGGRGASNGFMVNGGNTNDGVENTAAIIPNLDSIQEFRIITSNFDAEYGNYSGGQVNVVTKNGTNAWHGSGFEFARNSKFNATGYSFISPAPPRPKLDQSIYGGTLGGPIKKDKVFFFADFQGTYTNQAVSDTQVVPTSADMNGNVADWEPTLESNAGTVNGTGWAGVLTHRLASLTGQTVVNGESYFLGPDGTSSSCTNRDPNSPKGCVFPGDTVPTAAWDPVTSHMLQYILPGNGTTPDSGFITGNAPNYTNFKLFNTLRDYKESGRVDISTRFGTLFGYYFLDNTTSVDPFSSSFAGGVSFPGWGTQTLQRAQENNVGLTTTFKGNAVNNFRFTYLRSAANSGIPTFSTNGPTLASLGFTTPWGPSGGISNIFPALVSVPTMNIAEGGSFGTPGEVQNRYVNSFQWLDNWMKIIGTHTLQFGADYSYKQINARNRYDVNGYFEFDDANETGLGFADFLLGAEAGDFTQASPQILDSRANYISGYGEDSWRARSNLVLNFGIRYEVTSPWYDTQNKLETIVPGEQSVVFPGAPKGWVFPGDKGVPRTLGPIKYNKFAPRFGFVCTPSTSDGWLGKITGGPGNLSIRGGFGIFYTNFQDESGFEEIGDAPYGNYYQTSTETMMATPFVNRATQAVFPQQFPFSFPPVNVSASHPNSNVKWTSYEPITSAFAVSPLNTVPYLEEYSLGIQRAFGKGTILTVNYVGNVGRHLASEEQANPGSAALCLQLSVEGSPSNPGGYMPGTTGCSPKNEGTTYFAENGAEYLGTRILPSPASNYTGSPNDFPAFGQNPYFKTEATSNYNSLQANLKHQSHILTLMLGYTFGRSFDNASSLNSAVNVYNPRYTYGLSSFDVTHYLVGSYDLHLPFDAWTENRFMKEVIGGWSVSGITRIQTGTPISMSDSEDYSLTGLGDHPYYNPAAGPLIVNKNPRVRDPENPTQSAPYFNTADFTSERKECNPRTACYGIFGNSPLRFFHGPGADHTDLALLRDFRLHGEHILQIRLEAFDAFNHAWFDNPSGSVTSSSFGIVTGANSSAQRIMEGAVKYHF